MILGSGTDGLAIDRNPSCWNEQAARVDQDAPEVNFDVTVSRSLGLLFSAPLRCSSLFPTMEVCYGCYKAWSQRVQSSLAASSKIPSIRPIGESTIAEDLSKQSLRHACTVLLHIKNRYNSIGCDIRGVCSMHDQSSSRKTIHLASCGIDIRLAPVHAVADLERSRRQSSPKGRCSPHHLIP